MTNCSGMAYNRLEPNKERDFLMKKFGLLLVTCSLLLTACTQSEKKVPNFSRVTNRLSKVALTQENVVGISSSTSDKKASSQKSSTKKKEDKETKTETESIPAQEKSVSSGNKATKSGLSNEQEKKLKETIKELEQQGLTWEEIYLRILAESEAEFLKIFQESSDELLRIVEETSSELYGSISDTFYEMTDEDYELEARIAQYQWERDNLYDPLREYRQGSIVEENVEDSSIDWDYSESDYSSDWSPTYDNYTDYEPVEAIEPIIEGEN